jgi:hypothetical protein
MSPPKSPKAILQKGNLPDPLVSADGRRVKSPEDWPPQARAWRDRIVELEYGGLPPAPDSLHVESLCHSHAKTFPGEPRHTTYRITCLGGRMPVSFSARILLPNATGPVPAIVNGDGCWTYATEAIVGRILEEGMAFIQFNRTELAEDLGYEEVPDKFKRAGGLYDAYPEGSFGAIAAWAWGYHRIMDALPQWPFIDSRHVAITGQSRGGKTTLLAGATDPRIALVNENASGTCGSAPFRYIGLGGETLDILNQFPSWFGKGLRSFMGREETIPFDQNCLVAAIAPRPLLSTYSIDDHWSNPEGMVLAAASARKVYALHGVEDNHAFHLRTGPHFHDREDWEVLLDFIKWKWQGTPPGRPYNQHPYPHLEAVLS